METSQDTGRITLALQPSGPFGSGRERAGVTGLGLNGTGGTSSHLLLKWTIVFMAQLWISIRSEGVDLTSDRYFVHIILFVDNLFKTVSFNFVPRYLVTKEKQPIIGLRPDKVFTELIYRLSVSKNNIT